MRPRLPFLAMLLTLFTLAGIGAARADQTYLPAIVAPASTATATYTVDPFATATNTVDPFATATSTRTPTVTSTNTPTVDPFASATSTPTVTDTPTTTPTFTPTGTATSTGTATATGTTTSTPTVTPTPTATEPVTGPCPCDSNSRNCSDFDTQPEAQACMDFCVDQGAGDIHNLDGNADGEACESLPGASASFTKTKRRQGQFLPPL